MFIEKSCRATTLSNDLDKLFILILGSSFSITTSLFNSFDQDYELINESLTPISEGNIFSNTTNIIKFIHIPPI